MGATLVEEVGGDRTPGLVEDAHKPGWGGAAGSRSPSGGRGETRWCKLRSRACVSPALPWAWSPGGQTLPLSGWSQGGLLESGELGGWSPPAIRPKHQPRAG